MTSHMEALAELEAEQERMSWKPIETAPKDGRDILLTTRGGLMKICFWDDRHTVWNRTMYDAKWTHWMPLPEPPFIDSAKPERGG